MKKKKKPSPSTKGTTTYKNSSVASLRAITGLSEPEFAEKIGMTVSGYKSMVSRQEKSGKGVPHDTALRISAATGASASLLAENQLRSIFTNKAYTRADYDYYCSLLKLMHQRWKKVLIKSATRHFEFILQSILKREGQAFLPRALIMSSTVYELEKQVGSTYIDSGLSTRPCIYAGIEEIAREVRSKFESLGRGYKLGTDPASDLVRLLEHLYAAEMAWNIPSSCPSEKSI